MSRSYRKTPKAYVAGNSSKTMKRFKRTANRIFRRKEKVALYGEEREKEVIHPKKAIEVSDLWSSPVDGNQQWFGSLKQGDYKNLFEKRMRK